MRFGTFFVDGFGIHREQTFELDGQAPLVLFTGRNEAGKSTIMGFIRTMLFGFPNRSRMAERYEPAGGGPHGGSMTLIDENGQRIRLERYDKKGYPKLYFPDGREGGEAELAKLLGGLTPELYRNLFAFSLTELHRLETLQGDDVSGFLYGSGTGVSGNAVVQAEKRLASAVEELYKKQGKKQPIHEKLQELEKLEAEIRKSKESSGEYNELVRQLDELESRMAETEARVAALRGETEWLNKCVRAREPWLNIRNIEREWAEAPERYTLAPEAEALVADKGEVERWLREAERLARTRGEAAELRWQLDNERVAMQQRLRLIDPSWTIEEAKRFPFAIVQQGEVDAFKSRFALLETGITAARERLAALDGEGKRLGERLKEDEERAAEKAAEVRARMPAEAAEDPDGYAAEVNEAWMQVREHVAAWGEACRKREEARRSLEALTGTARSARSGTGRAVRIAIAAGAALLATVLILAITGEPAAGFAAGASIFAAGMLFVFVTGTRKPDPLAQMRETLAAAMAEAEREEAAAAERAAESRDRLLRLLPVLSRTGEAAAAKQAADPREALRVLQPSMDAWKREMAGWRKLIGEWEQAKNALANAERDLDNWRFSREQEASRLADLEERLAECDREWNAWLAAYRLPAHLRPDMLKLMGEYAQQAMEKAARVADLEAALARRGEEEKACREAALALLAKHGALAAFPGAGDAPAGEPEPEPEAHGADWAERLSRLAEQIAKWEAVARRRDETAFERRQQQRMLEMWIPRERLADLERELLAHDADQLADRLADAVRRREEAEDELGRLREESGRRKAELERLQRGEHHAGLLLESAAKEAELGQLAERYAVRAMAAHMIRKARETHERERQPGVLRRASRYFERITQGRYVRVLSPMGEKDILAETKDGRRISSAMLSRGTAEQLYLAMRFALAEEYERIINLPLVMDDIFVNFDRRRLAETLDVLAEVARRRQILLFTCHDHVAEAVLAAMPDSRQIELLYSS
jgi:uncharacterized protein YhaN